jgi:hypothetical protein
MFSISPTSGRTDVSEAKVQEDEEEDVEEGLEAQIANLDVALFSLVESLDTDVSQVANALDEVLKNSLWKRTLDRQKEAVRELERGLLRSRAEWLWRKSSAEQRKACFFSGLGRKPGLFLHDQLDTLVEDLVAFERAVSSDDGESAGDAALSFHQKVIQEPFFCRKAPPEGARESDSGMGKGDSVFRDSERPRRKRCPAHSNICSRGIGISSCLGCRGSESSGNFVRALASRRVRRRPRILIDLRSFIYPCGASLPDAFIPALEPRGLLGSFPQDLPT